MHAQKDLAAEYLSLDDNVFKFLTCITIKHFVQELYIIEFNTFNLFDTRFIFTNLYNIYIFVIKYGRNEK